MPRRNTAADFNPDSAFDAAFMGRGSRSRADPFDSFFANGFENSNMRDPFALFDSVFGSAYSSRASSIDPQRRRNSQYNGSANGGASQYVSEIVIQTS